MTVSDVFAPDGQKFSVTKERCGAVFLCGVESEKKGDRRGHKGSRKHPHKRGREAVEVGIGSPDGAPLGVLHYSLKVV